MGNSTLFVRILTVFCIVQLMTVLMIGQESQAEKLTNENVIELVKVGLSENLIIAKIKNSDPSFDTSVSALVRLKENGVSENIILAIIDAKPKANESGPQNQAANSKTADLKEAVGKRRIFLITDDDEARLVAIKKLSEKGFSFTDQKSSAELIIEVSFVETTTKNRPSIFRPGSDTEYNGKIGKLTVKLSRNSSEYLVYAHEYPFARAMNTAAIFGVSPAPPSLRDQLKAYLLDDFVSKMKKAGDKFK